MRQFKKGTAKSNERRVLTRDDELAYLKKIKNRDRKAFEDFMRLNQGLVISLARKYAFSYEMLPDLIAEGNLGLIRAIEKFNPAKNTKFGTYAFFWIKRFILRSIMNQFDFFRVPEHVQELRDKYLDFVQRYKLEKNRFPTEKEISGELKIPDDVLSKIKKHLEHFKISPVLKANGEETFDIFEITDFNNDRHAWTRLLQDKELLEKLFGRLRKKEKKANISMWLNVIKLHFGLDNEPAYSYKEIADKMGITRQRVHQIIKICLKKLKIEYREMKDERII